MFIKLLEIYLASFPDVHVQTCLDSPKRRALSLLPCKEDDRILRSNIVTMVSRVLTKHMPFFKHTFEDIVQWHIKHLKCHQNQLW